MSLNIRRFAVATRLLLVAVLLPLAGCKNKPPQPVNKVFASPEDAGQELLAAAQSRSRDNILAIFGPQSKDIILSGDAVQDKATVNRFISAYEEMHRWRKVSDGGQILVVGADNFAFPIPLKKNATGQWFFDTAAGKDEILARRIGRNEIAAIDVCAALAQAQTEYFSEPHGTEGAHQYAAKFISDAGRQNGLYWESSGDQRRSPLGPLVAFATDEGYSVKPGANASFHGYVFKLLKGQASSVRGGAKDYVVNGRMVGGFGFVAYPAQYGSSGVMTFIVNQDGAIYQKDLGSGTAQAAAAMNVFDPASGWTVVPEIS